MYQNKGLVADDADEAHSLKNSRYSTTDFRELVALVVKTACALHNWLRQTSTHTQPCVQRDVLDVQDWVEGRVIPGTARRVNIPHRAKKKNYTRAAGEILRGPDDDARATKRVCLRNYQPRVRWLGPSWRSSAGCLITIDGRGQEISRPVVLLPLLAY
ncbi:hypothetical protein PR048_019112 [Dryococelus australis]|uniref:Uncharacterized protein n=1 Tax=Dryococelus australis TaxID=614101 RepID=A0ABQ9H2K4_9NEOP|nr:hypothetical protein PR048_019112 [Dryococelus australis]